MKSLIMCTLTFLMTAECFAFSDKSIQAASTITGKVKLEFQIPKNKKLDLLFVIDNSGSMTDIQKKLISNIDLIVSKFKLLNVDLHLAVITSSNEPEIGRPENGGRFVGDNFLTFQTPNFSDVLKKRLNVGIDGSGLEMFFDPIRLALTEPLISTFNKDFLRSDATLGLIIVTDAEDQSWQQKPEEFITFLTQLKGSLSSVFMSAALIPSTATRECKMTTQEQWPPAHLEFVLKALQSAPVSLCDADFGNKLNLDTNQFAAHFDRNVALPLAPQVNTIQVTYNNEVLVAGDVNYGWIYDSKKQSIVIGDLFNFNPTLGSVPVMIEYVPVDWYKP